MSSEHGGTGLERLLIVRLSAMGDVIHTLPAVQAMRNAFPNAIIDWLIEERWTELLCAPGTPRRGPRSAGRPLVDWVHVVRLAGWRKSLFEMPTIEQIARVWNDVRSVRYQVALDLQMLCYRFDDPVASADVAEIVLEIAGRNQAGRLRREKGARLLLHGGI